MLMKLLKTKTVNKFKSDNRVKRIIIKLENHNKQIFHAFLFNIRNYSPEAIKWS